MYTTKGVTLAAAFNKFYLEVIIITSNYYIIIIYCVAGGRDKESLPGVCGP